MNVYSHQNLPLHVFPSPVNPGWHSQWNDPCTLVHTPFREQSWVCFVHSSISINYCKQKSTNHQNVTYFTHVLHFGCSISYNYVWLKTERRHGSVSNIYYSTTLEMSTTMPMIYDGKKQALNSNKACDIRFRTCFLLTYHCMLFRLQ